jgi:hypothetical protein
MNADERNYKADKERMRKRMNDLGDYGKSLQQICLES